MRLRTLPVSCSGVVMASALAALYGRFDVVVAALCLIFAVTAQIASNFANEYFDFRAGLDKKGRCGPRRGVTEGDISPRAMSRAVLMTTAAACAVGSVLLFMSGWWLLPVGVFVVLGLFAYSAGPYPLSRHALGEVAVVVFFGIVPVTATFYIMAPMLPLSVVLSSVAIGLMGANILLVNNYRDVDDDRSVGKTTLATKFGATTASTLYLFNGFVAVALMAPMLIALPILAWLPALLYLVIHTMLWTSMIRLRGARLNPLLGMTALNMLSFTLLFGAIAAIMAA